MVEIRHGDHDVTEGDQLTLEVRRDCDREYLRRASAFIRAKAGQDVPFFVYFNPKLRAPADAYARSDLGKRWVRPVGVLATCRCPARHPAVCG
jgi:hypothetical protein